MIHRVKGIRKSRSKPRPGRLKGKAMKALRLACFERDGYRCQAEHSLFESWEFIVKCLRPVTWESGHLAHIGAKRRHGDSLENVRTLCAECHLIEHQYGKSGVKPCPSKRG